MYRRNYHQDQTADEDPVTGKGGNRLNLADTVVVFVFQITAQLS